MQCTERKYTLSKETQDEISDFFEGCVGGERSADLPPLFDINKPDGGWNAEMALRYVPHSVLADNERRHPGIMDPLIVKTLKKEGYL